MASISGARDKLKKYKIDLKKADLISGSVDFQEIENQLLQIESTFGSEKQKFEGITQINRPYIQQASNFVHEILDSHSEIPKPSYDVYIKQMVDGYVRAKHNFPPGYEDFQDKYHKKKKMLPRKGTDRWSLKPEELTDYLGDYQLWCSILEEGKENDVLFVTGDLKSDWWKIPNNKKLEEYEPRDELVMEFSAMNPEKSIKFLPLNLFIYYVNTFYGQGPFGSYFLSRGNEKLINALTERLHNELASLFVRQLSRYERVSSGLQVVPAEDSVTFDSSSIEGFEIFDISEIEDLRQYSKEMLFCLQLEVSAEGRFEFPLAIEGEVLDTSIGDFSITPGTLEAELVMGFDVDNAIIEDIHGENINIADLEILEVKLTYFDTELYEVNVNDGFDPYDEYNKFKDMYID